MQQPNGGYEGIPWAFVLDPAANARALGDVQRRGLRAATEAVDRLLSSMEAGTPVTGRAAGTGDGDGSESQIARLATTWMELVVRGLSEMSRLARSSPNGDAPEPSDRETPTRVDVVQGRSLGAEVPADTSGPESGRVEVWLTNAAHEPIGPIHLCASDLVSDDGLVIPSALVRLDPPGIAELPGRSSRGIEVSVQDARTFEPGLYRGSIETTGAPAVWLMVELDVYDDPS